MSDQRISVTILEEKPVGYLIEMDDTHRTSVIPKRVFIRRIEAGVYDVSNIQFLRKAI